MKFDEFHIENRPKLVYSSLKLLDEHIPFLLSILLQGLNSIQSYVLFSSVDCFSCCYTTNMKPVITPIIEISKFYALVVKKLQPVASRL